MRPAPFLLLVSVVLAVTLYSQEKTIPRSQLPPAVEKAVVAQGPRARVQGFATEKENGETYYEAQFTVDGRSKDVLFDRYGNVVEVEEQVEMGNLPANVKKRLQANAGRGRLVKVETLTKRGRLVAYEAQVITNGKRSEVQVGPDGRTLAHDE